MEDFRTNLMRLTVAELHYANLLRVSIEVHDKPLSKLSEAELADVQQKVMGFVGGLYNVLTPEFLSEPKNEGDPPLGSLPPIRLQ